MRSTKWLWLTQSSVPLATWPYPWKDTEIRSSQNQIFCHFYDIKRHEAKKVSKGKLEISKSASHHFKYQITPFQISNNLINSTLRHGGCDPKFTLISGIIGFNDFWIINAKSNSGIWAKVGKKHKPPPSDKTNQKKDHPMPFQQHTSCCYSNPFGEFIFGRFWTELWVLSPVSSWFDSSTRCKMKGQQNLINNR